MTFATRPLDRPVVFGARLQVNISPDLLSALRDLATQHERDLSTEVRIALADYVSADAA